MKLLLSHQIRSALISIILFTIESEPSPRQKRVTCDLLSASVKGVTLNHSACAAHCIVIGFKGGHCSKGVCRCRR